MAQGHFLKLGNGSQSTMEQVRSYVKVSVLPVHCSYTINFRGQLCTVKNEVYNEVYSVVCEVGPVFIFV